MQRRKKMFVLVLAAVLVLAVAVGAFAEGRSANWFTFDGTCKRTFITDGRLILIPNTVSGFKVYLTDISEGYTYAYARPVSSSGATYGSKAKFTSAGGLCEPNEDGLKAGYVHAKIYNPLYEEETSSTTPIHIAGKMVAQY